jgi:hypothetical protein
MNRSIGLGRALAVTLLATSVAACAPDTPSGPPAAPLPCHSLSHQSAITPIALTGVRPPSLPPGIDFSIDPDYGVVKAWGAGYDARPLAEQLSSNGLVHVWAVAQEVLIGLGDLGIRWIYLYAQDTTTNDVPIVVDRIGHATNLAGIGEGWPQTLNIDSVADDGSGTQVSITYGQGEGIFYGWNDTQVSLTFQIGCSWAG